MKDEPLNDDIRSGRKSPFISNRAWPKALRTRSASKERVSARHNVLQGSIQQIRTFQEQKLPVKQPVPRNLSDSEDTIARKPVINRNDNNISRSQSVHHLASQDSHLDSRGRHKGILKNNVSTHSSSGTLRVKERINTYHHSIEEDRNKHQATLPWNSKICKQEQPQHSLIRKTGEILTNKNTDMYMTNHVYFKPQVHVCLSRKVLSRSKLAKHQSNCLELSQMLGV